MSNEPRKTPQPAARDRSDEPNEKRQGDILGLSDADPDVEIPRATPDRGGNPAGIEIGPRSSPMGGLHRSKGATGMDMGSGGTGTDVEPPRTRRPEPTE